jgi:hypothetical protein
MRLRGAPLKSEKYKRTSGASHHIVQSAYAAVSISTEMVANRDLAKFLMRSTRVRGSLLKIQPASPMRSNSISPRKSGSRMPASDGAMVTNWGSRCLSIGKEDGLADPYKKGCLRCLLSSAAFPRLSRFLRGLRPFRRDGARARSQDEFADASPAHIRQAD